MATPHLTSDNANATGAATADRLASVVMSGSSDTHLVIVTQTADWNTKDLLVTPVEGRWAACMATGIEQYPRVQGGTNVYNDTQNLINEVGNCMNSLSWRNGYHPCVNAFTRGVMKGPYSHRSGISSNNARAEYIHSKVAYRFKLHRLHFSKMSEFTPYLRVYVPSLVIQNDPTEPPPNVSGNCGLFNCLLISGGLYNGASQICCRVSTSLPALSADVAAGYDAWEIAGNANDGTTVSSDTAYSYHSVGYNPYHGDDCVSMPVWTANQRRATGSSVPTSEPTLYYHDFAMSNSSNKNVFAANPTEVWITAHFTRGNAFAANRAGNYGLKQDRSANAWFYRADLVFKCKSTKF